MSDQDDTTVEPEVTRAGWRARSKRALGAHPWFGAVAFVLLFGGAFAAYRQVKVLVDPPFQTTSYRVPDAPRLTAAAGDTIYRIDPSRSTATYAIDEQVVGSTAGTAEGTTQGIAGDLAVNPGNPSVSRVGEIVVNVEQFHSDSTLRDARIRSDFLQSHQYQLARFTTTSITGLPASIQQGKVYDVELHGDLTLKATTRPLNWAGKVRVGSDGLHAHVTADVKLSDFGVGPISIVGLVSTKDEARLSMDLVALDPSTHTIPDRIPDPTKVATGTGGPSFARTIRPILEANCAGCHTTGAVGADVWTLDTAGDARQYAGGIATVTANHYMPPWPASSKGVPVQHVRSLSSRDLRALADWAGAGGPLDVSPSTRLHPNPTKEPDPPRADVILKMDKMYAGDGTMVNDYRCFLLDPKFTTPTYVTGASFTPGTVQVVHHALIYKVGPGVAADSKQLDGADGRPGWSCGTGGAPTAGKGAGGSAALGGGRALFAGWVPGQRPHQTGKDQGFLFQPGDEIIVGMHYHYSNGVLGDRSTLSLQTTAPNPQMHNLITTNPVAPVELPCPAAQSSSPLCDRTASIADQAKKYGPGAALIPASLLSKCGAENVTSDPVTGNGTSQCDWKIATTGDIVDFMGHMHTRGKSFRMILDPGTPKETVLLDIPSWNFDWQINYQPVDPIPVQRGDTIRIQCSWDRSQRVDPSPRYITFAEGTEDEMCFSTYTIDPAQPTGSG